MGTILALIFIGVTAVTGIAVGLRPTIADGRLIADALVKRNAGTSLTSVECDREIRIAVDGATFQCTYQYRDRAVLHDFKMSRGGRSVSKRHRVLP